MNALSVNLGDASYDILIDHGILSRLTGMCAARGLTGSVAVVTNRVVADLYAESVLRSLADAGLKTTLITIPDGEQHKNSATLNLVYDEMVAAGLDRSSFVIALGGGVVGDLAGFAAATYMRGIPYVQVPTTLLSQVDSSVGGKTAIDHPRCKNMIGAFYQPRLVLIDLDTLQTLPPREYRAGLAEVIKYGVAMDREFFEYLESHCDEILALDGSRLAHVIHRCCALKANIVEQDEKESGLRAILNYGHTLGHAVEILAGYGTLVHGEAVAIGMALAVSVSVASGHCSESDRDRILALLDRYGLSVTLPRFNRERLVETLLADKKNRSGVIRFICNRTIGNHVVENLSADQLLNLSGLEV